MTLSWVSADLRTGRAIADLATFASDYPLRRTLCKYETGTGSLFLDGAPRNWEDAIREGGVVLAAYDDADDTRAIQWGGLVTTQNRDTANDFVKVSMVTAEGYFDRRFLTDVTYTATGQNAIVADLLARFVVDSDALPGLPITVEYATAGDGTARDRTYLDSDNATVYARLTQLAGVLQGCEWSVEWRWYDDSDGQLLKPVLIVGDRIGVSALPGLGPAAEFEMPGTVTNASQTRSYADGAGANRVKAYSSGQGDTGAISSVALATDFEGRPTFEYRYQPSSSISDATTLDDYAQQAVSVLAPGQRAIALTANLQATTRHGGVWSMGDDVAYSVGGLDENGDDIVRMFPGGLSGIGRAIAYELNESTISPIVAMPTVGS